MSASGTEIQGVLEADVPGLMQRLGMLLTGGETDRDDRTRASILRANNWLAKHRNQLGKAARARRSLNDGASERSLSEIAALLPTDLLAEEGSLVVAALILKADVYTLTEGESFPASVP